MFSTRSLALLLIAAMLLAGCNMPDDNEVSEADAILTAAAQTVQAQMGATATETQIPSETPVTPSPMPSSTSTLAATSTVSSQQQQQQSSCDLVTANASTIDVTIPDDTVFDPGDTFTKTWKLTNAGTCTWTSDYEIVFSSGDAMDGPAAKQLTAGTVPPGGSVEISVDLTAPSTAGTYQGFWKLRNADGVVFGFANNGAFWVKIKVGSSDVTAEAGQNTVTLNPTNSGSVRSSGATNANPYVGDTTDDLGSQAFLKFDISSIPSNATIDSVEINFGNYTLAGDPFGELGCLRAYHGSWFPLDAGDYVSDLGALLRYCSSGDLSATFYSEDVREAIENALGDSSFELRLHFNETESNNDGIADQVRFGAVSITVSYTVP